MRKEQSIKTNNNQMEEKGMKSRFIHFKKRFVPALSGALMGVGIIWLCGGVIELFIALVRRSKEKKNK